MNNRTIALALAGGISPLAFSQVYSVMVLDKPLPGTSMSARYINDSGSVVMDSFLKNQWLRTADGTLTRIGLPNNIHDSFMLAINGGDGVAGHGSDVVLNGQVPIAFTPQRGTFRLPVLPGFPLGSVYGVNDSGQATGSVGDQFGNGTGFLSNFDGSIEDLGDFSGYTRPAPLGLNNKGVVVGQSSLDGFGTRAVKWTRGTGWQDLGVPPGSLAQWADKINDDGMAVGLCIQSDGVGRVGVYEPGKPSYVVSGPLADHGLSELAINGHGDMAGAINFGGQLGYKAAYWLYGWPNAKYVVDLLDASGAGYSLTAMSGINNKGQMAGAGFLNGSTILDALILTPHSYSLPPSNLNVKIGKLHHGSLASLGSADGDALGIRRFFVPTISSPVVSFTVSSKTAIDSLYLWLKIAARANGAATMKVSLWDVQTKSWDTDYPLTTTLGSNYSYSECIAKRRLARYMDLDTTVQAKIDVKPVSFDPNFMAEFDQASFEYVPASG